MSLLANPEFRRHVWLELTPHRLVVMPVLLAMIFLLVGMSADTARGNAIAFTALAIFALLCPLWGARLTVDSVADEFRDKTWDTQRMFALTSWVLLTDVTHRHCRGSNFICESGRLIRRH